MVLALFILCLLLHYPQQILGTSSPSVFSFLGLTRHAIERIFLLIPICYAGYFLGQLAGLISVGLAAVIMLPRDFLISQYLPDSIFETIAVIIVGILINLWFEGYRRERKRQEHLIYELEVAEENLRHHASTIAENEKRLLTLIDIAGTLTQSLEVDKIINSTLDGVVASMHVENAWIHLFDPESNELVMAGCRGNCQEFPRIKVGFGLSGSVAKSGNPLLVNDLSKEPRAPGYARQQSGSALFVPFSSKNILDGTIGVNSLSNHKFQRQDIRLLAGIGNQLSIVLESARIYEKQQKMVDTLRISEQKYRELFENAHDAILVHDMEGNITDANRASELLTGHNINEMLGMNVRTFLAEESLALAGQIRHKLLFNEVVEQPYEQRLMRRDGTVAVLQLVTSLIKENGRPVGFQHIARDVTREKEMQAKLNDAYRELMESHKQLKESQQNLIQAEKLTSLGQLAASIAHEVNNPLSGILIYTQLLSRKIAGDGISKETVLDYLSKMESEIIRSTKLIRNLLDFARQSAPTFRQVNINEVINKSTDLAFHSAELQKVQIIKQFDPSLPELRADFDQLLQVFTNLVLNAIQAMPAGGKLTLRTSTSGGTIKAEVIDTGCGIPVENISKLFTPFFTTKHEVKGVGLGLAIAYGIIQRHKGKIEVQSKVGEGTTFTICLPIYFEELK